MSRTKRNVKHWYFKSHSRADFAAWAEALVETDYQPRNRHLSRSRLVSAWDDRYPSALADKWQWRRVRSSLDLMEYLPNITDNNYRHGGSLMQLIDITDITLRVTHEQFEQLCQNNPDRSFELTKDGELEIMPPTGGESSKKELGLGARLYNWNEQTGLGETFSSSGAFILPNGAERSPDAAWVELSRWEALTAEQREKFPPLAPDFVIELRSKTDSLTKLQQKMAEYRDNGVRLGWLINPQDRQVEIYRPERDIEILEAPATLSGEDVLPGFVLDLRSIL